MRHFWIIDTAKMMRPIVAVNKEAAIDKYNDKHALRADFCFPAEVAPNGKYYMPVVPEWMHYTLADGIVTVKNVQLVTEPNEHGQLETFQKEMGRDNTEFFEHRKPVIA